MTGKKRGIFKRLNKFGLPRWAVNLILVFLVLGVGADFLANEKPIYCKLGGRHYFPVLIDYGVHFGIRGWPENIRNIDWYNQDFQAVVRAPVPYSPGTLDLANANFRGPFSEQRVRSWRFRHWLGTDALGRDVTAGMLRGCRIALLIGIFSMLLAASVGIPLGALMGYFGDSYVMRLDRLIVLVLGAFFCLFYFVQLFRSLVTSGEGGAVWFFLFLLAILIPVVLFRSLGRVDIKLPGISIPIDFLCMRGIEVFRSMPAFFLLFALLGMIRNPSVWYVLLFIALLRWPTIARYVRAEALKIREQNYILSAKVIGLRDRQIVWRHVIPNALGPVFVTLAFGMGTAVLLESGLSFLGIGLGVDEVSWGKMLNEARKNFSAWWMAVFPGAAIFLLIASFQAIGDSLQRYYQPQRG